MMDTNVISAPSVNQLFDETEKQTPDMGETEKTGEQAAPAKPQTQGETVASENATLSDTGTAEKTAEQRKETFDSLIKGEYKDLFDEKMQKAIKERLKNAREANRETEMLLSLVAEKYGVTAGDKEALKEALAKDRAMESDEGTMQEKAESLYTSWMESADKTKEIYPDFDLQQEMKNPRFLALLRSKVDVKTAYEVLHKDEILPAAMEYAAKTVEAKLTNRMLSTMNRPYENGNAGKSPTVMRSNVSGLSKEARQDIIRRVQKGEKIRF